MAFSYDSESNFTYWKIASAKPINTNFCGRDEGGLWIIMLQALRGRYAE